MLQNRAGRILGEADNRPGNTLAEWHLFASYWIFNRFPTSQTHWCSDFWTLRQAFIKRFWIPNPPPSNLTILTPCLIILPHHSSFMSPFYGMSWILKSCTFQVQTLIIPSSSGLIFSDLTKLLRSCRLYSYDRTTGDNKRITLDREINRKQFSFPIQRITSRHLAIAPHVNF